jgi:hypothetical protein
MIALSKIAILSEQHLIVAGDPDAALDVIQATADGLEDLEIPRLTWAIESVEAGGFLGFLRKRHDYLVVRFGPEFPEHLVLVGCWGLGASTLQVSFLVAAAERFGRRMRRALRVGADRNGYDEPGAELSHRQAASLSVLIESVRLCLDQTLNTFAGNGEAVTDITVPDFRGED